MNEPIYILIRTQRRTLSIQIREGKLIVRAPMKLSLERIEKFIYEKSNWIKKHLGEKKTTIKSSGWNIGDTLNYLGKTYSIDSNAIIRKSEINFNTCEFVFPEKYLSKIDSEITQWFRDEARKYFHENVPKLASIYGFLPITNIRISSAKTRWGSCSSKNSLSFSYRLMQFPTETIDAVIIHELAHTREKNHSKGFWKIVYDTMPDYDSRTRALKGGVE